MTTLDEIAETFELLGDWEQRYAYLIELGEQLPEMPEAEKKDKNKVKGCMSQVWTCALCEATGSNMQDSSLQEEINDETINNETRIYFHGDCDTSIIKGVLALLLQLTSGKSIFAVEQLDVDEFFERLRLHEHLSPNRHFGIYAIVAQMKKQARALMPSVSQVC